MQDTALYVNLVINNCLLYFKAANGSPREDNKCSPLLYNIRGINEVTRNIH